MKVNLDPRSQAELNAAVQKLADAAGATVKEVLPAQMRLFAADLAFNTRPIGKKAESQQDGKDKIESRISDIYIPVGAAYEIIKAKSEPAAVVFSKAVKSRNFAQAAAILSRHASDSARYQVGEFDGGEMHKSQAFTKRVSRKLVVINYRSVERYSKEKQKLVGFAKGGFATAARELGGVRGIPGYATRQKAPGRGYVRGDGKNISVTLENHVRHIDKALDRHGEERATQHRTRAIKLVLKRMMDRKIKNVSRSLRS